MGAESWVVAVLVAINVAAFLLFVWDLTPIGHGRYEVRERQVLAIAFLGGSIGALIGQRLLHAGRGTRRFRLMLYILVVLHLAAGAAIYGLADFWRIIGRVLGGA